ncbi:MAG: hypothetical protein J2P47_05735 [Acetobacteraceae bacterium]|nr:hypothetical protein [Acetobacteraceae bacterium]
MAMPELPRAAQLLPAREIQRLLRLITSSEFKRNHRGRKRVAIAHIAAQCGLSRRSIYNARNGYVTERVQELLSELLPLLVTR